MSIQFKTIVAIMLLVTAAMVVSTKLFFDRLSRSSRVSERADSSDGLSDGEEDDATGRQIAASRIHLIKKKLRDRDLDRTSDAPSYRMSIEEEENALSGIHYSEFDEENEAEGAATLLTEEQGQDVFQQLEREEDIPPPPEGERAYDEFLQ